MLHKHLKYIKKYWISLIIVLICAIVGTILSIAGPKILGNMTTEIVKGFTNPNGIDFDKIREIGLWLIGLYVSSAAFGYVQNWIMTSVSQRITYSLRKDVSKKISKLPLSYFDKHESGDIVSRVTNDIETISQNLNQSLIQLLTSVVTIIGILAMMLSISVRMTLIALIVSPSSSTLFNVASFPN